VDAQFRQMGHEFDQVDPTLLEAAFNLLGSVYSPASA
jgi:hypothetical protein